MVPLRFEKPRLVTRVVPGAPFQDYLTPFMGRFISFTHKQNGSLNARQRPEYIEALEAISESQHLAEFRQLAQMEIRRLGEDNDGFPGHWDPHTGRPKLVGEAPVGAVAKTGGDAEGEIGRPISDVPTTNLDLGEGDGE